MGSPSLYLVLMPKTELGPFLHDCRERVRGPDAISPPGNCIEPPKAFLTFEIEKKGEKNDKLTIHNMDRFGEGHDQLVNFSTLAIKGNSLLYIHICMGWC